MEISTTVTVLTVLMVCFNGRASAQYEIPDENRFNFFDLELLQKVASTQSGNILVSPASVKATLGLILEAAGGRSAEQIRHALRLPENQRGVQKLFRDYLQSLKSINAGYKLQLSNRVYLSQDLSPKTDYRLALQNYYYADVDKANFARPEQAASTINRWVNDVTRGLIPVLVEPSSIGTSTKAMIANAIYFKGKWKTPFDPDSTISRCFYVEPERCVMTNMMETMDMYGYSYIQALDSYALELPYEGNKFSMLIVLPKTMNGMPQLVRDILHQPIHQIAKTLERTEVLITIPRFNVEYFTDLMPILSSLGIKDVFNSYSNLTGMFDGDFSSSISNVFHKTRLVVNEEGSEGAAATGALVIPLMGTSIPKFRADHPFLYFIRDTTDNTILFAGRVSVPDPSEIPRTTTQRIRPRPPVTRRPSKPVEIELKQDQNVFQVSLSSVGLKVSQVMNDSFVFPTTTPTDHQQITIGPVRNVPEVLPLHIPSSQTGQNRVQQNQNGYNQPEMRPQNNHQSNPRPQNSHNQQESRPQQSNHNQQESRPQQTNHNQQESRPQQTNHNQQESRPQQSNHNQQESRPQQTNSRYQPTYQQPDQRTQNTHQQPDQRTQNTHQQPDQRTQNTYQQPDQRTQNNYQQPDQRTQNTYQQPDQRTQNTYQQPDQRMQNTQTYQDANRRLYLQAALPLSIDMSQASSQYQPSRTDNRVSPVYRAQPDISTYTAVEIRPDYYARQQYASYDPRDHVNYPK